MAKTLTDDQWLEIKFMLREGATAVQTLATLLRNSEVTYVPRLGQTREQAADLLERNAIKMSKLADEESYVKI